MQLTLVMGTRPEVIKLAPLILEAKRRKHDVTVVLTGQHRHMALPLLQFFGIEPDLDLDVMAPNQTLTSLSAHVLQKLDANKDKIQADYLIVQGDTTSAAMAGYWGFCHKIPVVHVEAGLRTYDLTAPFPEEANRQLIGRIADLHFAPTRASATALKKEQISQRKIHTVGNTAIDSLHIVLKKLESGEIPLGEKMSAEITQFVGGSPLVLVTAHRRENFGSAFEDMCNGILSIVESDPDLKVVYPVHPNPNVRQPVEKMLKQHPQILLCDPQPYVAFIDLMKRADVLLTDSGGVQEEGPTLRKPIIVMRNTTERPEGLKAGFSKLVGTNTKKIKSETLKALKAGCKGRGKNPYGDGKTSARIVRTLERSFVKANKKSA